MNSIKKMEEYADETGGVFSFGEIEAIPYNHWKQECEWMVLVIDPPANGAFIPVSALTAKDACTLAIYHYGEMRDFYE